MVARIAVGFITGEVLLWLFCGFITEGEGVTKFWVGLNAVLIAIATFIGVVWAFGWAITGDTSWAG